MTNERVYSRKEIERLREATRAERTPECPRCLRPLTLLRHITPMSGVSYVRRRVWWTCPQCRRDAVLDR